MVNAKILPRLDPRTIVLIVCAGLLTFLVISRSLSAYLADANPLLALWLSPHQPQALVNLADRTLNPVSTSNQALASVLDETPTSVKSGPSVAASGSNHDADVVRNFDQTFGTIKQDGAIDLAKVGAQAEAALMRDPLDPRALRILGQIADIKKDDKYAYKLMAAAVGQSLHESIADYWLLKKNAEIGSYDATIYFADALMRTNRDVGRYAIPVLAQLAGDKRAGDLLTRVLSSNPPWRGQFFAAFPLYVTDARTPLAFLLALKSTSAPPTPDDVSRYLQVLVAHKVYDLAYYTWLQFLSPAELQNVGLLYNGNFEGALSASPFDWQVTEGAGVTIDIVRRADKSDQHALMVDFQYGRVEYRGVSELVVLPPGSYQFAGKYKGNLVGPRGLKWRVACAETPAAAVAESPMLIGSVPDWSNVEFSFTIPPTGCRAQYVRLDLDARTSSEQLISGSMLFDELQILRTKSPRT